jgi:hypothetical protein
VTLISTGAATFAVESAGISVVSAETLPSSFASLLEHDARDATKTTGVRTARIFLMYTSCHLARSFKKYGL